MSFGSGYENMPTPPGEMLASEADREATQDVLKQAFEDERLNQDEFEARIGKAVAARTQGDLAALTRDLPRPATPPPATRPSRRIWLLAGGAVALVVVAIIAITQLSSSGPAPTVRAGSSAGGGGGGNSGPAPTGVAKCPVGTTATAQTIADALARDPVYVDPGSSLTSAQAGRLQAEIGRVDPGRIRVAVVTPATVRSGGGDRVRQLPGRRGGRHRGHYERADVPGHQLRQRAGHPGPWRRAERPRQPGRWPHRRGQADRHRGQRHPLTGGRICAAGQQPPGPRRRLHRCPRRYR